MVNNTQSINLTIRGRDGIQVNKEDVFAVTSINSKGLFDILPEHENFISIIKDKVIVHRKGQPNQEIKLGTGVLEVNNNVVNIFLGMHGE
jgi:F0F1-type ATP synthase epsilon subunit